MVDRIGRLEQELAQCRRELSESRDREQRYRRPFETMFEGFGRAEIILDDQGRPYDFRLLEVNEAFGRLTGFSPAQANGRTARELVPSVEPYWVEIFGGVALTGEPAQFENRVAALDKWFEVFAYQTNPGQFAFLFVDISERKRAERAAIEQFKQAEAVFTHSVSSLVVLDRDYNFLRVNETYARACRRDIGEFAGRNHFEMYPSDAKRVFDEVVRSKQSFTGSNWSFVFPDQPERGVTYWDWTLVPVLDEGGEVECLVLSLVEVTDRALAEAALRESEMRYRQQAAELELVYRTAPVGLCVVDTQLRYVHINQRLAELNGIPAADHLGKTVREVVPAVADRTEPLLRQVLTSGEPVLGFETNAETEPGVWRHWISQYWPLKSSDGAIFGVNAVVQDVTERKWLADSREREREFRTLAENSTDIIARFDRGLRRIYVNPAIERILGRPRAELLGKTHHEIGLPETLADYLDRTLRDVFNTGRSHTTEATLPTPRGERYLESRLVPEFDAGGQVETVLVITHDITERKHAEEALYRREQEFAALVEKAPDIIARVDRSLHLLYINQAVERLTGKPREWFLGKHLVEQGLPPREVARRERALGRVFATGREQVVEHKNPSLTGERYFQARLVPEFGPDGEVVSALVVDRDIDDLKRAQKALEELTLVDPLTGVGNRRYLERFVGREWRREARRCLPVAVIMVDIDYFKAYNDRYGHAQGDECLRRVAEVLRQSLLRPADLLIRYGGEEFVVILPECDRPAAQEIAQRLRHAVEERALPHAASPLADRVTVSLGVAALNACHGEFRDLIAAADEALYLAKAKGRNRIETSPLKEYATRP